MNKVEVLVEGYAKVNSDGTWDATSSTTFIDTGKHKIIMDPGCNRKLLLKALEIADYIIPGHGKMFKVDNSYISY